MGRLFLVHHAGTVDGSKIAHAPQQPVGDTRRSPRTAADFQRAALGDRHPQNTGGTDDHAGQLLRRVELQTADDAETVPQRRGKQADARRGAHERERLQIDFDGASGGPLPYHQIEFVILKCRIQDFLHGNGHPVDFVHKQDVVAGQIGQDGRQIAAPFQHRAGRADQVDPQFRRHDLGERRFPEAGVSVKKDVIHRLPAFTGGVQEDAQIGPQLLLSDEILQTGRTDAFVTGRTGFRSRQFFRQVCGGKE